MSDLERAQNVLSILKVSLRGSTIKLADDVDASFYDQKNSSTQFFNEANGCKEFGPTTKEFWFYLFNYKVGTRLIEENATDENTVSETGDSVENVTTIVEILADFDALYGAKEPLSQAEIDAFSENNVAYHIWPYWREYVHSTCGRIGLHPSLTVPLYKMRKLNTETLKNNVLDSASE